MKRIYIAMGAMLTLAGLSSAAGAEALRVTLDKYEFVKLDRAVATVLIANPSIVDVGIENARLIILVGRTPGETMLVILDNEGNEILTTAVVVVPKLEREVTVHRGLAEATLSCYPRCAPIPNPGAGPAAPAAGAPPAETGADAVVAAAAKRQAAAAERQAKAVEIEAKARQQEADIARARMSRRLRQKFDREQREQ